MEAAWSAMDRGQNLDLQSGPTGHTCPLTQIAQNDPGSRGLSLWNLLRTGQLLSSPASSRLKGGGKGLRLAPWRWGAPSLGLPRLLSWSKPEKPVSS